jgi:hypothetical protein
MPEPLVLVPWRPSPEREVAWSWVADRYREHHPDWELRLCEGPDGPWCKAAALMPAAAEAEPGQLLVIADADVWCEGILDAVQAVRAGAAWAIPHLMVHRLTAAATSGLCSGAEPWELETTQAPYQGVAGGGLVVLERETVVEVPLDRRFVGWGQEDQSWAIALACLFGEPWRGTAPLIHLWHPPQPRLTRARGSREGWRLRCRYSAARTRPAQMRALLEEATP